MVQAVIVSMWMRRDVISVGRHTLGREIVHALTEHRLRRLPVVEDGKVVGMVSRVDILRAMPGALNPFAPDALHTIPFEFVGSDVMVAPAFTLHARMHIGDAVDGLSHKGLGSAPVVRAEGDASLVGILSQTDLARAFREVMAPSKGESQSIWEMPDRKADEAVPVPALVEAVGSAGGVLRGVWHVPKGSVMWLVVVTKGLDTPDVIRTVLSDQVRLLHVAHG